MKSIVFLSTDSDEIDKLENLGESNQISIKTFENVQDFLMHIVSDIPELVILDNEISTAKIPDLVKKLKEKDVFKNVPILVITSPANIQVVMELQTVGVKDFLIRPYLTKALLQKIKDSINLDSVSLSTVRRQPVVSQGVSLNIVSEEKRKKMIMNELDNLPAFPVIVQKVIQTVNDRHSSAGDFEQYVSKDQTLTAKVLRMANSPFYKANREIMLIRDAVVTLGYNTIRTIAFAAGTGDIFKKNLPQYGLRPGGLWKHSLSVAMVSRIVGKDLGFNAEDAEELFVCGLLHDIGKLILGKFIKNEDKVYIDTDSPDEICKREEELTGFNHSELGEIIAKKWKLPPKIGYTIKYHHHPDEPMKYHEEVAIVNLADYVTKHLRVGFNKKNISEPQLYESVKSKLAIDDAKVDEFIAQMEENIDDLDKMAGM